MKLPIAILLTLNVSAIRLSAEPTGAAQVELTVSESIKKLQNDAIKAKENFMNCMNDTHNG